MGIAIVKQRQFDEIIAAKEDLSRQNKLLIEQNQHLNVRYNNLKTIADQLESESSMTKNKIDQLNDDLIKMASTCRLLLKSDSDITPIQAEDSNFDQIILKFDEVLLTTSDPAYKMIDNLDQHGQYLRDSAKILKFINGRLVKFDKCLQERRTEKIKLDLQTQDINTEIEWLENVIKISKTVALKIESLMQNVSNAINKGCTINSSFDSNHQ